MSYCKSYIYVYVSILGHPWHKGQRVLNLYFRMSLSWSCLWL